MFCVYGNQNQSSTPHQNGATSTVVVSAVVFMPFPDPSVSDATLFYPPLPPRTGWSLFPVLLLTLRQSPSEALLSVFITSSITIVIHKYTHRGETTQSCRHILTKHETHILVPSFSNVRALVPLCLLVAFYLLPNVQQNASSWRTITVEFLFPSLIRSPLFDLICSVI